MFADIDRVRDLLEDTDPASALRPDPEIASRNLDQALLRGHEPRPSPAPSRPRPLRRTVTVGVAMAMVAVVAVVALTVGRTAGPLVPPALSYTTEIDGIEVLAAAADGAAQAVQVEEIAYWRTEGWFLHGGPDSPSEIVPEIREYWLSDATLAYRSSTGDPLAPTQRGAPRLIGTADGPLTTIDVDEQTGLARELPSDPDALLGALRDGGAGDPEVDDDLEAFVLAGEMLATHAASPAVQAGLLSVLPQLEGVEVLGMTVDRAGRSALSIGLVSDYSGAETRYELLIDAESGQLRAIEETLLDDLPAMDLSGPAVISYTLHLDTASAPRMGVRP